VPLTSSQPTILYVVLVLSVRFCLLFDLCRINSIAATIYTATTTTRNMLKAS
jgi:hypothetical protein